MSRQQCLEKYLFSQTDEFFEQLAQDMAWDRDMDEIDRDAVHLDAHDFLKEGCVRKRGEFA